MKKVPGLLEYFLQDCLEGDRSFSIKNMFGGYGIYKNEKIFALYAFDQIYFKTGTLNIDDFQKFGSKIFAYEKQGKIQTIRYYTLPEEIMEDKKLLLKWIEKSLQV